ncbi:hypothetical protein TRAPUB_7268 [Trametes pubescens]|uniref:Uncharacterized protein n=1 Tax=Trametes pubescens TaxID=154538 RepID=A0A1M2V3Q7_TRAPU|nr:hypothetical protein TRAPUB_7268 [Trametes pubescens]
MSLSDFDEARPPMPTQPLDSDADADADFATTQTQCRLVRGQRQVKPRNRDRRPEYRPLIDGGANFQFKLLSLRDAQRRHSIVYHAHSEEDDKLKTDTTPGPGPGAGEFKVD